MQSVLANDWLSKCLRGCEQRIIGSYFIGTYLQGTDVYITNVTLPQARISFQSTDKNRSLLQYCIINTHQQLALPWYHTLRGTLLLSSACVRCARMKARLSLWTRCRFFNRLEYQMDNMHRYELRWCKGRQHCVLSTKISCSRHTDSSFTVRQAQRHTARWG